MDKFNILAGIQSRTGSTRFPRKVFQTIGNKALIRWVYDSAVEAERILRAKDIKLNAMILGPEGDRELESYCDTNLMKSYFPPFVKESDLILRYLSAAHKFDATHIVRITSDCWQMNPELIVECVQMLLNERADYICNTAHRSFIEGLDLQACTIRALRWFDKNQKEQREHPFVEFDNNESIRKKFEQDGFKYIELINPRAEWTVRTSIDTKEDLERANLIYEKLESSSKRVEIAQ